VYVLCVPSRLALPPEIEDARVEENATLSAVGGFPLNEKELTHTRARENTITVTAPPRLIPEGAASVAAATSLPHRPELHWPTHRTPKRRIQREAAASEVRERAFLLRPMSVKDVASSCREYFQAGWTVYDIMHALDWLPDGTRHPNSGIPSTKEAWRLRGWLNARLRTWRNQEGDVLRSATQRRASAEAAAIRRKNDQDNKILTRQACAAAITQAGVSPAKTVALAAIRALFDGDRRRTLARAH
jgi:hypothetical protein